MGDLPDACHALRLDLIEAADIRGALTRLRPARPEETHMVYEWAVDPAVAPYWGGFDLYPDFDAFTADWGPHYFDGTDVARGRVLMIETLPHEGAQRGSPSA